MIRRELALVEGGVFNTEALKYSVRRLNQLGYFKPLDDRRRVAVERTPGTDNQVDVKLKVEEQNRNQLNFGAGASQYDGLFGNVSYTTVELPRPRREPDRVAAGRAARANNYQLSLHASRSSSAGPMTAGASVFSRKIDYAAQRSAPSTTARCGAACSLTVGRAAAPLHARCLPPMATRSSTPR